MMALDAVWRIVHDVAGGPFAAPAVTVASFVGARYLQKRWPNNPLFNPTLVAVVIVIGFIEAFDISYATYLASTQIISFLLGPAVVLLAVPLYRRLALIRASWPLVAAGLLVGMPVGVLTSVTIGILCGAEMETIYALAPKSVTAGIAMGIEEGLGGIPALTAVFVISTGIMSAAVGPWLLSAIGMRDHRVVGIAMGLGGHGIGTARAFQVSNKAGAFASLAMALNGVLTAILIPFLASMMNLHLTKGLALAGAPRPAVPSAAVLLARAHRIGSELWAFLLAHQSQLLAAVSIMLTVASFVTLMIASRIVRGGHRIDQDRLAQEKAAKDKIAALERLVTRQALQIDITTRQARLAEMPEHRVSDGNTVPFRRSLS